MENAALEKHSNAQLSKKDLTGIDHMSREDIGDVLVLAMDYAETMKRNGPYPRCLQGKVILNLFFENSTRTRTSFEIAAKRLGADVINWHADSSALSKGESFDDTIATLGAMTPEGVIIRHSEFGAPEYVAARMRCPVINAGDSWREHPSQALLDALTMQKAKGLIEGLTVAICGDIAHSRVARSNMILLRKMGAQVHAIAPSNLMPDKLPAKGIKTFDSMEDGLKDCDVVMMLRVQKERMAEGDIGDDAAYFNKYGLTMDRLKRAKDDAVVMHPGPMNRGVEIADDVADDPHRSLILQQVANGIPVRMAILDLLVK